MARIEKKIWPEYFDLVSSGKKKYELRLADFDVKEGDTLVLREWDPKTKEYTGRQLEKKVAAVSKHNMVQFSSLQEFAEKGVYLIELE